MVDFTFVPGEQFPDGDAAKGKYRKAQNTIQDDPPIVVDTAVVGCPTCGIQFGLGDFTIPANGQVLAVSCWRGNWTGDVNLLGWSA